MNDLIHAFAGKYALYVLGSWGLSLVVIGALVIDSLARAARWRKAAEARETLSRDDGADAR
jgi:heme exporter protein CcmD